MTATLGSMGRAMNELIDRALDAAQAAGAQYADIRITERETESLTVKNGALEAASSNLTTGFGVRVLVDGAWGFAGSAVMTNPEVERVTREAVEIARASGLAAGDAGAARRHAAAGRALRDAACRRTRSPSRSTTSWRILFEADAAMARVPGVTVREGSIECGRERKTFASSEGARIEQELIEAGAGIEATAVDESESQVRSWPNSAGGQHVTGGFEAVRAMDLPGNAQRIAEEAVALLTARGMPVRTDDPDHRIVPDGAAGARVVRPSRSSSTACSAWRPASRAPRS